MQIQLRFCDILWRLLNCRMVMGWCRMPNFCGDLDKGARFYPPKFKQTLLSDSIWHWQYGRQTHLEFLFLGDVFLAIPAKWSVHVIADVVIAAVWQMPLCCMRFLFERRRSFPHANHRLRNWNTIGLSMDTFTSFYDLESWASWIIWEIYVAIVFACSS